MFDIHMAHRILIVEDDPDINEFMAYSLRKEGFPVRCVYDGTEAKATIERERFDIVILDLMLPGVDGFDICRAIKESPGSERTFVVVVSARASQQDKLYAHILGADCYLTKPFSVKGLVSVIHELSTMLNRNFLVRTK